MYQCDHAFICQLISIFLAVCGLVSVALPVHLQIYIMQDCLFYESCSNLNGSLVFQAAGAGFMRKIDVRAFIEQRLKIL